MLLDHQRRHLAGSGLSPDSGLRQQSTPLGPATMGSGCCAAMEQLSACDRCLRGWYDDKIAGFPDSLQTLLTFLPAWPSIGVSDVRSQRPGQLGAGMAIAYEQVFRDAGPGLWRTIYAFSGGRSAVADDAVAEAFARAMERADQIRDPVAWLYRTAFRIATEDLRRGQRDPEPELPAASTPGLGDLIPVLRQLSPAQRAAVVLHYEADLPVREVARQMGTSVAAVKVHLFRGRRRLRELLGGEEPDNA